MRQLEFENLPEPVYKGDALEHLRRLGTETVHLVVTDPPYDSLEKHRAIGTTTRLTKEWFDTHPLSSIVDVLAECHRVLTAPGHCYVFCDQETAWPLRPELERIGFKVWKALVWSKAPILGMGYHYRAQHELVLFCEKRKGSKGRRLASLAIPDVLVHAPVRGGYPTEKPLSLGKVLVEQSSLPDEIVLDPWCGSGTFLVAALELGRRYMGVDASALAVERTKARIAAARAEMEKRCGS